MSTDLHIRHRPTKISQLIGNPAVTNVLKEFKKRKTWPHAFMLTGPSGCGKTTTARLIAKFVGCDDPMTLTEQDSGVFSGVDNIRDLIKQTTYASLGESGNKAFIIDECHALSKNAWSALLKTIEDPPAHVYFIFSTTEEDKIIKTVMTRCTHLQLQPTSDKELRELVELVMKKEEISFPDEIEDEVINTIAAASDGSPRQALVFLSLVNGLEDIDEIEKLLASGIGSKAKEIIDFCRAVSRSSVKWEQLIPLIQEMKEHNPESIRITTMNYLAACALKSKKEREGMFFIEIMSFFDEPYRQPERFAPLLLSVGRMLARKR